MPGYVRVLEGRLDDAAFTFDRDVAVGIHEMAGRLGQITFFEGGGTLAEKAERLVELVDKLGGDEDARQAASLAKADQASELVREFPTLEGAIGGEYARLAGLSDDVCTAIAEHYLPDGADAALPTYRGGPDPLRRGQDRHADGLVRPRPPSDRLARPVRPAPGGDRPLPARRRRRRRRSRGRCSTTTCATSSRSGSRAISTCPSSTSARRARSGEPDVGAVAELATWLAGQELATVHEVYVRASRIVGDGGRREAGRRRTARRRGRARARRGGRRPAGPGREPRRRPRMGGVAGPGCRALLHGRPRDGRGRGAPREPAPDPQGREACDRQARRPRRRFPL